MAEPKPAVVYVPVEDVAAVVRIPAAAYLPVGWQLEQLTRYLPPTMQPVECVKVPAAWLVEDAQD